MIEVSKKILEKTPEDKQTTINIGEALILGNRVGEFDSWYEQHKNIMDSESNGALMVFLRTLRAVVKGDLAGAKSTLVPFVAECANGVAPRLGTWEFDEATLAISRLPDGEAKTLASNATQFFRGALSKEAMQAAIA
jgi:hypothetical protein